MSLPDDESASQAVAPLRKKTSVGSLVAAIFLAFLGFLSLLSTGCFGVFAFVSKRGSVDGVFLAGMLVMAAVTAGFIFCSRAVFRAALLGHANALSTSEQPEPDKAVTDE